MAVLLPEMPPEMLREFERGPVEALVAGVQRTGELSMFTLNSIGKMLKGLISPKNLSGPITIAKVASASAKSGLESYISFLALLSVSLGVLNLLPIPVLDGGHLMYYTLELLAGRPVPEKIQAMGYQVGLFLVLGIMVLALYNDIARL
jgi:regulator of sigma E protease